jgi:DNA polymerase
MEEVQPRLIEKSVSFIAERAAANAMMHPGKIYPAGRIAFSYDGNCVLRMHLPSTDGVLHYLDPKLTFERNHKGDLKPQLSYKGVDSVTKQWVRQQTYGGKLVENATQAVARDAMCVGMIRLEEAGYLPVLQVHDEPLTERDEGTGCVHEVERLMTLPIVWAPDLPLKAKTWTGKRYVKQ